MWALDHKEGWALKNWCFWTVVLEKTLESPLDCKEIKPGNSKGNQPWLFIGRTDAEVETPILWPPDAKGWLFGKDPDAGKDWRWKEKGTTEDEMVGWHHWLNGHEFEQAIGVGDGWGGLACCRPWLQKELDMTEWLNNNSNHYVMHKSFSIHKWNTIGTLSSVTQSCLTLWDPMNRSMSGLPVHHQTPKNHSRVLGYIDQNNIHPWSGKPVIWSEHYEKVSQMTNKYIPFVNIQARNL